MGSVRAVKYGACLEENHVGSGRRCAETSCFLFSGHFGCWEKTDRQLWWFELGIRQTFSQKRGGESVHSRTTTDCVYSHDTTWAFRRKLEFWRSCICHCEPASCTIHKEFSDINGDINKNNSYMLFNAECRPLEAPSVTRWTNLSQKSTPGAVKWCRGNGAFPAWAGWVETDVRAGTVAAHVRPESRSAHLPEMPPPGSIKEEPWLSRRAVEITLPLLIPFVSNTGYSWVHQSKHGVSTGLTQKQTRAHYSRH